MISPVFLEANVPSTVQNVFLVLLAILVPPLPIYLLTGPNYTVKTKEFLICLIITLCFTLFAVFYALYFVLILFPNANEAREGYIRIDEESPLEPEPVQAQEGPEPSTKASVTGSPEPLQEAGLPSYEESEGSSTGEPRPDNMNKFGDHKVQH